MCAQCPFTEQSKHRKLQTKTLRFYCLYLPPLSLSLSLSKCRNRMHFDTMVPKWLHVLYAINSMLFAMPNLFKFQLKIHNTYTNHGAIHCGRRKLIKKGKFKVLTLQRNDCLKCDSRLFTPRQFFLFAQTDI